jgi:hypothetical protein
MIMKKIIVILFLMGSFTFSQDKSNTPGASINKFDIAAGMGVKAIAMGDVIDYINSFQPLEKLKDVSIAPEFYISPEMEISDDLGLKFEYSYLIKSFDIMNNIGSYSFTVTMNSPSVILHYLLKGNGYYFKIGGGLGYRFGSFSQKIYSSELNYYSKGAGLRIDLAGHTSLGGNLYAVIAANLSADFMSDLKDDSGNALSIFENKYSLGSVGAALSFGLSYYF